MTLSFAKSLKFTIENFVHLPCSSVPLFTTPEQTESNIFATELVTLRRGWLYEPPRRGSLAIQLMYKHMKGVQCSQRFAREARDSFQFGTLMVKAIKSKFRCPQPLKFSLFISARKLR